MKSTLKDLTGLRFGRWLVLRRVPNRGKSVMWECQCDCGTVKIVHGTSLKGGTSTNCGCVRLAGIPRTHGLTHHPLYRVWQRMKGCTGSPTHQDYHHYGARGISMCDQWKNDFHSFYTWSIEHGWEPGLEIDRVDVDGDYCPENCRFTDRSGQMRNTRRNHMLTLNGKTQPLVAWAEETGIKSSTLYGRLNQYEWSVKEALTTEVHHANRGC
jgi:hypothetical protein